MELDLQAQIPAGKYPDPGAVSVSYTHLDVYKRQAQSWDNVGLLVGDPTSQVSSVLVALDVTQEVAEEAAKRGCGLIVAHHPLMNCAWSPVQSVRTDQTQGKLITTLIQNGISAICMHTNLDSASGGVNDALAAALGLKDIAPLSEDGICLLYTSYAGEHRAGQLCGYRTDC